MDTSTKITMVHACYIENISNIQSQNALNQIGKIENFCYGNQTSRSAVTIYLQYPE